jgi:hypothetical protein
MVDNPPPKAGHGPRGISWRLGAHIAGFAVYAWLLSYLMVWTGKASQTLALYAAAMAMHILPVSLNLRSHDPSTYDRRGAPLLALASLGGWACALMVPIPAPLLLDLVAFVAGGVIINSVIVELSHKREGSYVFFLTGTAMYAALLLTLSHFEQG